MINILVLLHLFLPLYHQGRYQCGWPWDNISLTMGQVCSHGQKDEKKQNINSKSELHYVKIQPPNSNMSEFTKEVPSETLLSSPPNQQKERQYLFPSSEIINQGEKICGSCPKSDSYSGEPESIKSLNDLYNKSPVGSQEQGMGSQIAEIFENSKESNKAKRNHSPDMLVKKQLKTHSNLLSQETGGGNDLWQTT